MKNIYSLTNRILLNSLFWLLIFFITLYTSSGVTLITFGINFVISFGFVLFFTFVTNRLCFSIFVADVVLICLYFATLTKINYLGSLLNFQDLDLVFSSVELGADDMFRSYGITDYSFIVVIIFICIFAIYLLFFSRKFIEENVFRKKMVYVSLRLVMFLFAIVIYFSLSNALKNHNFNDLIVNLVNSEKLERVKFTDNENFNTLSDYVMSQSIGPVGDVFHSIINSKITYKFNAKIDVEVVDKYLSNITPVAKRPYLPDVILVLNESTFNPNNLDYKFAKKLKYEFFNDEYTKGAGRLAVHTFGGGSSLSEYAAMTGVLHNVFTGPTSYPFLNMSQITKVSLAKELSAIGYYTIVIYPVSKKFLNAENAYRAMGISRVVDIFDYDFTPEMWRNVPDSIMSLMVKSELEKAPRDKPVFIFMATMINHGPHDNFLSDILGCNDSLTPYLCGKFNDYIRRLESTNRDFKELTNYLMSRAKHTVYVNFGDHLPSFEGQMEKVRFASVNFGNNVDKSLLKYIDYYTTFYNIRTNFDIDSMYSYNLMDISYIPSIILDIIGVRSNKLYQMASLLRKECNGLLIGCKTNDPNTLDIYKSYMCNQLDLLH